METPVHLPHAPARTGPAVGIVVGFALDALPSAVIGAATIHELLYDDAPVHVWVIASASLMTLLWWRRAPVTVFAATTVLAVALCASNTFSVGAFAVLVALYSVAAHREARSATVAAVLVEAGSVVVAFRFAPSGSVNDAVLLLTGLTAAALFAGTTRRAQRRYLVGLTDRADRLERERAQQAELAAAAERARIAREMHDVVAHGLSVVVTLAQGASLAARRDPERAAVAMEQVAGAGRQTMTEMRRLLDVLRTDDGAALAPQPVLTALSGLADEVRRTGLVVHLHESGERDALEPSVQTTVYRVVQESLTNVLKHATGATVVDVTLRYSPDVVRFDIADDGAPPAATTTTEGNGLTGMRERIALFHGNLAAGSCPDGWRVRGELRHGSGPLRPTL